MPGVEGSPQAGQGQGSEDPTPAQEAVEQYETSSAVEFDEAFPRQPEGEPEKEPEARPDEAAGGPARDPSTGRFVSREQAPTEGEAETAAPAAGQPPTDAAAEPKPESDLSQYPTFQYRGDGRVHEIPGSAVGEAGVFIPKEQVNWLRQELATARAHHGSWQSELESVKAEADQKVSVAEAKAAASDKIVEQMTELAQLARRDPDAAYQWVVEFAGNWPAMQAEAERASFEAERDAFKQQKERTQTEEQSRQLEEAKERVFQELLDQGAQLYPGVDPRQVGTALRQRHWHSLWYTADHDDPAGNYKKGQLVINTALMEDQFRLMQGSASKAAGEQNQAAVAKGKSGAPPVAPAKGGETPSTTPKAPKFKSRKEYEDWLESGAADKEGLAMLDQMK